MADILVNSYGEQVSSTEVNLSGIGQYALDVFVTAGHIRNVITTKMDDMQINSLVNTTIIFVRERLGEEVIKTDVGLEIIKWLTAHLISLVDDYPRTIKEKVGDSQIEYSDIDKSINNNIGFGGIMSTRWGRVAVALDESGKLALAGSPKIKLYSL